MGTTGKTQPSIDNYACECVHAHQGGWGVGESICSCCMAEMCLMDAAMCMLRCLGWEQWQEFKSWRESGAEMGGEALRVFERLWATKWVKQVSSRGRVITVTFSALTSSHLVAEAQGQNVHSLLPLPCSKPFCVAVLITARGDPLHIHTLSRENHTTDSAFSLQIHTLGPSLRLSPLSRGNCITFTQFFSFQCFVLPFCLLIILIISQVEPRLTHWTRQLSNQSSATEVIGKTEEEKGGRKEVKEEKEAHGLAFFLQQASLLASPSLCPIPSPLSSNFSPSELSAYPSPPLPRW